MKLYKYCDKTGVNILRHKVLRISRIDEFNDPYEFKMAQSDNNDINNAIDNIYRYQKEAYRVLCFTSECNNPILWGHYSKNHTGILVKFDTALILVNGNAPLSTFLEPVEYKDDMITIPGDFMKLDRKTQMGIIQKNTFRKYTDWQYEKEDRGIVSFDHKENKRYLELAPESILEVVIGLNCDLETELTVKSILGEVEYRRVELKRSFLHETKYEMKYVDMNT